MKTRVEKAIEGEHSLSLGEVVWVEGQDGGPCVLSQESTDLRGRIRSGYSSSGSGCR